MKFIHFASTVLTAVILANPVTARLGIVSDASTPKKERDLQFIVSLRTCATNDDCLDGQRCGETHEVLQKRVCEDIPLLTAGSTCTADEQCDTGFCITGVCPKECTSGIDCTVTERCAAVEATETGERSLCVPLSPAGYSCTDDAECASGLCFLETTCMIPLGGLCTSSADCVTNRCVYEPSGTCEPQEEEGAVCRAPFDGISGHCFKNECVLECAGDHHCRETLACLHVENKGDYCLDPNEYAYTFEAAAEDS